MSDLQIQDGLFAAAFISGLCAAASPKPATQRQTMGCGAGKEVAVAPPEKPAFKIKEKPDKEARAKAREERVKAAQKKAADKRGGGDKKQVKEVVQMDEAVLGRGAAVIQEYLCVAEGGLHTSEIVAIFKGEGAANTASAAAMWNELQPKLVGLQGSQGVRLYPPEHRPAQCESLGITGPRQQETHARLAKLLINLADPFENETWAARFNTQPTDVALWSHLMGWIPYHLTKAGMTETLEKILCDVVWLEEKCRLDVPGVLDDFWRARTELGLGAKFGTPVEEFFSVIRNNVTELLEFPDHVFEIAFNLPSGCAPTLAANMLLTNDIKRRNIRVTDRTREREWSVRWAKGHLRPTSVATMAHSSPVSSVRYTPDNLHVVTSEGSMCYMWDSAELNDPKVWVKKAAASWDCVASVCCLEFSSDSKLLYTGGGDGVVRVWDFATQALDESAPSELNGHTESVLAICVTNALVATASQDQEACIWDPVSRDLLARLRGHTAPIRAVAFSMDGLTLATGSADNTIRYWSIAIARARETQRLAEVRVADCEQVVEKAQQTLEEKQQEVAKKQEDTARCEEKLKDPTLNSDDPAMRDKNSAKLMELQKEAMKSRSDQRKAEEALEKHDEYLYDMQMELEKEEKILEEKKAELTQCISDNGEDMYLVVDSTCIVDDSDPTFAHMKSISALAFTTDNVAMASAADDHLVKIWDRANRAVTATLKSHSAPVTSLTFNKDCSQLVSCAHDKKIIIWDMDILVAATTLMGHREQITSVQFNNECTHVVTSSVDRTARIWDLSLDPEVRPPESNERKQYDDYKEKFRARNARLREKQKRYIQPREKEDMFGAEEGHSGHVNSVAFSKDGFWLASGGNDCQVKVWDATSNTMRQTLLGHTKKVNSVTWSQDNLMVFSCSDDGTVRVWEVISDVCKALMTGHTKPVNMVAVNKANDTAASASDDGTVKIWYMPIVYTETAGSPGAMSSRFRHELYHKGPVTCLAFSPDDGSLASGSLDMSIIIWDYNSGVEKLLLEGHHETVTGLGFKHDNTELVSAMGDKTLKVLLPHPLPNLYLRDLLLEVLMC